MIAQQPKRLADSKFLRSRYPIARQYTGHLRNLYLFPHVCSAVPAFFSHGLLRARWRLREKASYGENQLRPCVRSVCLEPNGMHASPPPKSFGLENILNGAFFLRECVQGSFKDDQFLCMFGLAYIGILFSNNILFFTHGILFDSESFPPPFYVSFCSLYSKIYPAPKRKTAFVTVFACEEFANGEVHNYQFFWLLF